MEDRNNEIPQIQNAFVETPKRYRSEARGFSRIGRFFEQPQPPSRASAQCGNGKAQTIYQPRSYDDVQKLIDKIKMGEQVIVNFANVNRTSFYRMIDFMSGAVYALNGTIQNITQDIYIFAPYGAKISNPEG